jgi:membrane protease YdiL (CAAX protease family)
VGLSKKLYGWFALVGGVSAISYAGRLAGGKPPKNALFEYSTGIGEVILFAIILAIVFWIARDLPKREAFALRRPDSWGQTTRLALRVLLAIVIVNAALDPLLHGGREQGLTPSGWQSSHAAAFAVNLFVFAVIGPITEELTFRGLGFYLLEPLGQIPAIVVIGITFGLWHGLIEALPVLIIFGLGLAFLRSRTRSIYPCMLLHALFNGAALVLAVTV